MREIVAAIIVSIFITVLFFIEPSGPVVLSLMTMVTYGFLLYKIENKKLAVIITIIWLPFLILAPMDSKLITGVVAHLILVLNIKTDDD
jgi:hypothetical protein